MKTRNILRAISFAMLIAAIFFVSYALSNPEMGTAITIGTFTFGSDLWRVCYAIYAAVMVALFAASFFVKKSD